MTILYFKFANFCLRSGFFASVPGGLLQTLVLLVVQWTDVCVWLQAGPPQTHPSAYWPFLLSSKL